MSREWKGSVKPRVRIRPMEIYPPDWIVFMAWFGLGANITSAIMHTVSGSLVWVIVGVVGALWLAYYLWSHYQTRRA